MLNVVTCALKINKKQVRHYIYTEHRIYLPLIFFLITPIVTQRFCY